AVFSLQVADENYRTHAQHGGGPLYVIGIYCINAARYLFGFEPLEVMAMTAKSKDARFREIEETVGAILKFPNEQMATFISSFGAFDASRWEIVGEKGRITLDPAFDYELELNFKFSQSHHEEARIEPIVDQFAPELLYFSD